MTYNKNDWTLGGWVHFLEGYTIYLSSVDDLAFSPTDGILVSDVSRGIPIVTIREERHILRWVRNLMSVKDRSLIGRERQLISINLKTFLGDIRIQFAMMKDTTMIRVIHQKSFQQLSLHNASELLD